MFSFFKFEIKLYYLCLRTTEDYSLHFKISRFAFNIYTFVLHLGIRVISLFYSNRNLISNNHETTEFYFKYTY